MVDDRHQLLRQQLKHNGYSVTKARLLVFELLLGREPQSMHDLLTKADGRIDRVSLYRTIGLYEELGIVQRLQSGWKYKLELSDSFSQHHHHLTCLGCGKVIPLEEDESVETTINRLSINLKFKPLRHQLEIQGYCLGCAKKES